MNRPMRPSNRLWVILLSSLLLVSVLGLAYLHLSRDSDRNVTTTTAAPGYPTNPVVIPPSSSAEKTGGAVDPSQPSRLPNTARPEAKELPTTVPSIVEVTLGKGRSAADVARLGGELGFRVRRNLERIGVVAIESLDGTPIKADTIAQLVSAGVAREAEPTVRARVAATPTDPRYVEQWGFKNTGQSGGTVGSDMNAEPAWNWARGDGIVVAVVDEGVMFTHPDLAGQQWVNADEIPGNGIDDDHNGYVDDVNGWDFLNSDKTVWDESDGDLHGTHVAGTIAAVANNGAGGVGTAWNAKIMSLKFLGPDGGTFADGAAAILYAVDNGAKVINCSWGGSANTTGLQNAFQYAADHGVLIASAAGNETANNDTTPSYPASTNTTNNVTVAALDRTNALASYSNYGATSVDLGAPGSAILSTKTRASAAVRVERTAAGGSAPYSLFYFAFPIERLSDAPTRNTLISTSIDNLATAKSSSILVVNDSWHTLVTGDADYTSSYTTALSAAGYTNVTTWNTATQGTPTLTGYNTVVWYTGLMSYPLYSYVLGGSTNRYTLSSAERTAVGNYLNAGGNMLLSSPQLADDLDYWFGGSTGGSWFREYTQCIELIDNHQNTFAGKAGGLFNGMSGTTPNWLGYPYSVGDEIAAHGPTATPLVYWTAEYLQLNGTSMATPHVAGAIALARSRTPGATATEIRQRLMSTTVPVTGLAGKSVTGGRLDAAAFVGEMQRPSIDALTQTSADTVRAEWTNFPDAYFGSTKVLCREGAAVAGPTDPAATTLYQGASTSTTAAALAQGSTYYFAAYSQNTLGSWTPAATATITVESPVTPTLGTLVDAGFESGADGAALTSPPWTIIGTPQHAEYDTARAKKGTTSALLQGPAAAGSAGIAESASSGMTTNGAELRFWMYADTTNEVRYLYDLGATAQAFTLRLGGDGTIATYTNAGKSVTGYTPAAYTNVGTYASGWTQVRVTFDFTGDTFTLSTRRALSDPWTRLKAAGAANNAIPMRTTDNVVQSQTFRVAANQNADIWLDDVAYSDTGIVDGDTTPPTAPGSLVVADHAADQGGVIDLSWSAATDNVGVIGYQLYRGTAPGVYGAPTPLGNVTTYTDATAVTGTRYYYAVAAIDAAGNEGAKSPESSAIAIDNLAPSTPAGLGATGSTASVALSWTANAESDLAGYNVYRDGAKVNGTPITGTTFTDTGLAAGTTFSYRLSALDTHGNESAQSVAVSATTLGAPPATGSLIDAGFESGADGTALASPPWTIVGTPQHAEYDTALAKNGTTSAWLTGPAAAGSAGIAESASADMTSDGAELRFWMYADTTNEVRYLYDLGATAQAFTLRLGGDGTIATYTNAGKSVTGYTPAGYTTIGTYATGWTQVRIAFDFTGDTLTLSTRRAPADPWTQLKATGATGFAIPMRTTDNVTQSQTFRVAANSNADIWLDDVAYSNTGITDGDTTPPTAPSTLSAADTLADAGGSIDLSWSSATDNVGVTGYKLYRGTAPGVYGAATPLGNVTTYTDATATTGTRYYYAVSAVDAAGNEGAKSPESSAIAIDNTIPVIPGTLVDAGFESGADGTALSSPPWTIVGTPQHAEYDTALAKNGATSAWLQGPAAAGSAGIAESASAGMTSDGAELRFWMYADTTNEVRYLYDLGATAQAFTLRLGGDGTIATYTNTGKNVTGYTPAAYTNVGTYQTGWTQVRVVFDFTGDTFALSTRRAASDPWTQLKASGAGNFAIPMRTTDNVTQSQTFRVAANSNADIWLDDVAYSDAGITQ